MKEQVGILVEHLNTEWLKRYPLPHNQGEGEFFSVIDGKKYFKIVERRGGVWGFVVKEPDGKFKQGDVLKARNWSSPAKNFARGNIYKSLDYFKIWGA